MAALKDFNEMRCREGAACAGDMRARSRNSCQHHAAIQAATPGVLNTAVQKFKERVAKLLEQTGPNSSAQSGVLEREVVLMADRLDISEELARLQSHLGQCEATLAAGGEAGKNWIS